MCLIRSLKTEFLAMCKLSQYTSVGVGGGTVSSSSSTLSHTNSPTTFLKALYSSSTEDKDIVSYFFDFQVSGLLPSNKLELLTDLLESVHAAQ